MRIYLVLVVLLGLMLGCHKLLPDAPADDQLLDGPVEGLSAAELQVFMRGDIAFNDEVFTTRTGLGPLFVATSCGACHAGDGKGHPFSSLTRFGQRDATGNQFLQMGGPQLQHRAIPGYQPEQLPAGATFSTFLPPANTGLGFLDLVPDATILALADEFDTDGDGISGRPNWIHLPAYVIQRPGTVTQNGKYIGRFGKKASVYDLLQQTANAYNQDMGISSSFEPVDTYSGLPVDPEVGNNTVNDVVFYLRTLKAPVQRQPDNPIVQQGRQVFLSIRCGSCHTPSLTTGPSSIPALANQRFAPYTDLLLHDMGHALDDGYTEGNATTAEWRTPALWGLGLSPQSQGGQYFLLHDGRANSIEAAILLHGGEALDSRTRFQSLNTTDKNALLQFLKSL